MMFDQDKNDPRATIDPRIDGTGREGLTGTTPQSIYKPLADSEQITTAPDGKPMDEQPAWRQDFPIDVPQDNFLARRDFVKFLVLTSLAFAAGQGVLAAKSVLNRNAPPPGEKLIYSLSDLAVGATVVFRYPGDHDPCILTRVDETTLVAYSQKCTHLACAVIPKPDEGVIHCPCHNGMFELSSGRALAGPPRRPLPRIVLSVRGNDIYAVGIERSTV